MRAGLFLRELKTTCIHKTYRHISCHLAAVSCPVHTGRRQHHLYRLCRSQNTHRDCCDMDSGCLHGVKKIRFQQNKSNLEWVWGSVASIFHSSLFLWCNWAVHVLYWLSNACIVFISHQKGDIQPKRQMEDCLVRGSSGMEVKVQPCTEFLKILACLSATIPVYWHLGWIICSWIS